jgi:hypothetical protein
MSNLGSWLHPQHIDDAVPFYFQGKPRKTSALATPFEMPRPKLFRRESKVVLAKKLAIL